MQPPSAWLSTIRTSFWFLPTTMAAGAALLARLVLAVDTPVTIWRDVGTDEESRALLSTLAGSIITVTGVVFSLTIVTLHLASNQYGPRLLRSFMRDRRNQAALGTFVATFTFCLVSLVGRPAPDSLSVALALALTGASVLVLILFIHHMAISIQAETIIDRVGDQLESEMEKRYPRRIQLPEHASFPRHEPVVVRSFREGFVVSIDRNALLRIAKNAGGDLKLVVREGHYVIRGDPLMLAWAPRLDEDAGRAISLDSRRTEAADVEFSFQQLTQMALRALSPGINDPFTAISCIYRLTAAYCRMAEVDDAPEVIRDENRVIEVPRATFTQMLQGGLGALRHHATSPQMQAHLIDALGRIGICAAAPDQRAAVRAELQAMLQVIERSQHPDIEDQQLRQRWQAAMRHIGLETAGIDLNRR